MKTKLIFLLAVFLFFGKFIFTQTPTYTLKVDSMRLIDIPPYEDNAIEFGVYLTHTNAPTPFIQPAEQIFFSFNPGIVSGDPLDTTVLNYSIIGSQLPVPYQPRNPRIGNATDPSQTLMRLAINAFQGCCLNITGATNLLIVRMRLWSRMGPFNLSHLSMSFRNPPIVTFATRVFANVGVNVVEISTPETHTIDSSGLISPVSQLSIIPEGLYYPLSNSLIRRDTVTTYLRNIFSPYNIVDSAKRVIDTITFSNRFIFNNAPWGTYYIVSKHFNSIETWSKSGGEQFTLGDTTIYDFTISDSQAFGNNMKLKGNKYTIYSGDINQDGIIDGSDFSAVNDDVHQYATGVRLPTDLNADNFVGGSDYLIVDNNSFSYISVIRS